MFGETGKTRYDLSFRLWGIPIRIHPFFWLIAVLFSPFLRMGSHAEDMRIVLLGLIAWTAAWFLIFIIHEMGHALVIQRVFGANPWIILYGFGGAACHQPYYKRIPGNGGRMLISLAGPGAALAAVTILLGALRLCGVPLEFGIDSFGPIPIPTVQPDFSPLLEKTASRGGLLFLVAASVFVNSFVWMGLFWSVLNLLPIQPLDGGHIMREFCRYLDPRRGIATSLMISIVCSVLLLFYCLKEGNSFMAIFFGLFAWTNYQEMTRY